MELYDLGVTAGRTFYFVMELLEGMDLESLVRRKGPVPSGRVSHILRQVCESLEEAHARGLAGPALVGRESAGLAARRRDSSPLHRILTAMVPSLH